MAQVVHPNGICANYSGIVDEYRELNAPGADDCSELHDGSVIGKIAADTLHIRATGTKSRCGSCASCRITAGQDDMVSTLRKDSGDVESQTAISASHHGSRRYGRQAHTAAVEQAIRTGPCDA